MIHNTKFYHGARRIFLCSIMFIAAMLMTTSCGDDEPDEMLINYYIDVEEPFLVNSSDDFTDRYYNPVKLMKEAIQNTYPTPDAKGNDEAVIAACDAVYERYITMYSGKEDHLTCLSHLTRVKLEGTIVRQSEKLMTYRIDINPTEIEE